MRHCERISLQRKENYYIPRRWEVLVPSFRVIWWFRTGHRAKLIRKNSPAVSSKIMVCIKNYTLTCPFIFMTTKKVIIKMQRFCDDRCVSANLFICSSSTISSNILRVTSSIRFSFSTLVVVGIGLLKVTAYVLTGFFLVNMLGWQ